MVFHLLISLAFWHLAYSLPDIVDYVIVGGGTCGLTIANRLSECPDLTVAVIEAGGDERNNPNVTSVAGFGLAFNTPIDWQYETTAQTHAGNRVIEYHSGKALGGTSAINGMTYIRGPSKQIDAWETLGNTGWNWKSLYPYYLKSEHFQPPTLTQSKAGASYVPTYHDEHGPLKVGYPYALHNGSLAETANLTWQNLGLPFNGDPNGGKVRGFSVWPQTLDRAANVREDSARAYYYPIETRSNLFVLRGVASRIHWADADGTGLETANDVEYIASDGTVREISVRKEVILSAGSIRSPALLELSGVGNPRVLNKYHIPTKVDLPSVGENAQDQPNNSLLFSSNDTYNGTAPYVTYASAADILGPDTTLAARSTAASLTDWAEQIAKDSGHAVSASALAHVFRIQHGIIFEKSIPSVELLTTASGNNLVSAFWTLLPFSRGSVHIASSNPQTYPSINPNYFMVPWDMTLQTQIAKLAARFWDTQPIRKLVGKRVTPSLVAVPHNATDSQWGRWLKGSFSPNHHLMGTAAMLPRKLGGVVDETLTVYGTHNVRVVDASILPTQVSGHLSSTLYAISERVADMIKGSI